MSRARGEGTIVKRKDGRWQASLQVCGVRRTIYGRTRREAAEKLAELRRQGANGLADSSKRTVADLVNAWLETTAPNLRAKTLDEYKRLAETYVLPSLGETKLSRLQPLAVERLLVDIQVQGHGRTAQRVYLVLHRACAFAVRWRWLSENPIDRVQRPQHHPAPKTLWTPEQVTMFLEALQDGEGGQYAPLLGFLLASGCRIGEALGLRWHDVDLSSGVVHIERQITELRGKPIETTPKTDAGVRSIALPSWGVDLLRRQSAQARGERVFTTSVGTVPLQGNVRRALHALCTKLRLPRLCVHDLRHISLSLLVAGGMTVKDLQKRAGHATPRMTLEIYTHILQDADRQAAQVLERLLEVEA